MARGYRDEDESESGVEVGTVTLRARTDRAILCAESDGSEQWWPLSQVHDDSEVYGETEVGDSGRLVVTRWIARERGLA